MRNLIAQKWRNSKRFLALCCTMAIYEKARKSASQAAYEGSIPFTRSSNINDLLRASENRLKSTQPTRNPI